MTQIDERPDPDALLKQIEAERNSTGGKLKIFFGYAAGVGKTYAMLEEARALLENGTDVVAGYIEPHTRPATAALAQGIPLLPPKTFTYRNMKLEEFDIDGALERKPALILVDELAHTNAEGSRNKKRYQDVEELLNAGIDVYTTINVQHVESLNDIVQRITGVVVRETVPDYIIDQADKVRLIDIDPEELLRRFSEGKIYSRERATEARRNFFTEGNLSSLREIAMRKAADQVSRDTGQPEKKAAEKILVCIGPSPSSAGCIRAAARMAEAWHAPWIAVTVVHGGEMAGVRENTALAARLGARIVSLQGNDIAVTIAEYSKLTGITNIVIGKRKMQDVFRNPFKTEFADRIAYLLPDVEVHIIPDKSTAVRYHKISKSTGLRQLMIPVSPRQCIVSLAVLAAATGISYLLKFAGIGTQNNIIMVYILGVLIVSRCTEGFFYGAVSSVLAVLTFNFFFTEPYFTLNTIQPEYPVTFLIMLIAALITSALTVRIKAQAAAAAQRERRTELLYDINNELLSAGNLDSIRQVVEDHLTGIFSKPAVLYTADPVTAGVEKGNMKCMLCENEQAVVHWVFSNGKKAGAGTDTFSLLPAQYFPVPGRENTVGVVGIGDEKEYSLTQDNITFIEMVTSLAALAIERQTLSDRQREMTMEAEREKLRYDFLRGLSHDLRTPLTAILGASNVLLENSDILDTDARYMFASEIRYNSQWLMRMVENVLAVTKIGDGSMKLVKKDEAVEEVVAEAAGLVRSHFPSVDLVVTIPDDLLIIPMDGTLIEQVLINLIENAVRYAGSAPVIGLTVTADKTDAVFTVSDDGAGIPAEDIPHLFDGPVSSGRKNSSQSRGMGIGLMICSSIVKAHGGTISVRNRTGGGAEFRFTIPRMQENADGDKAARTDR
jgi:two-component system, OmpR family, sensor histidine kinase KdpD